jgi:preprotein translocase subunit SecA
VRARPSSRTLPSYLNALTGKGVHVVTVNDYLAKYQSEQMGRIHHFLGLEVGVIPAHDPRRAPRSLRRRHHLRHQQRVRLRLPARQHGAVEGRLVQRGHHYAIVDEVDSILVDEARTPLIISGPAEGQPRVVPGQFASLVTKLIRDDVDYEVDEKKKTVASSTRHRPKVEDRSASRTCTSRPTRR